MKNFIFDLQRFDTLTINAGESYEVGGITYTALENIQLTTEGTLTTVSGGRVNLTFEGMQTMFDFDTSVGALSYDSSNQKISLATGAAVYLQHDNAVAQLTAKENISATFAHTRFDIPYFNWDGTPTFGLAMINNGATFFGGDLTFYGSVGHRFSTSNFSLNDSNTYNIHDSWMQLALGNYKVKLTTDGDTTFATLDLSESGKVAVNFYDENYNAPILTITRGEEEIFASNIKINGSIVLDNENSSVALKDGSSISLNFDEYTVTATAKGDFTNAVSFSENAITLTPGNESSLDVAIGNNLGSMNANMQILSGSFSLSEGGNFSIAENTELKLDFGNDYIVDLKTTGTAGGSLLVADNGFAFEPNSDDGGLQIAVTQNGVTRTTSLNMNGELTYKLDGSISLAKDTVVKNVFEDGNELTITAKTDASGSIIFHPTLGLMITPSTPDALEVDLAQEGFDIVKITSIDGTIIYNNGAVTGVDGTKVHLSVYDNWESELTTTGGSSTVQYMADRTVYTANEGATFLLDYLDGTTVEIQNGSYSDIYETEDSDAIEVISAGSTFRSNDDEFVFMLEKAGSYNLNGIPVTTTSDNVQVQLTNYDTVIVDGISYTPIDGNVQMTIDSSGATVSGGRVNLKHGGFEEIFGEDVTEGAISYSNGKFTVKSGTKTFINGGNFPVQFVAQNDFSIGLSQRADGIYSFTPEGTANFSAVMSNGAVINRNISVNGEILANPQTHTLTLPKGTSITLADGAGGLIFTALDDAGGVFSLTENGGVRFAPNENDGALELNFANEGRKAALNVNGAFVVGSVNNINALSLEDGTTATLTWEDGNKLQLNSRGSTGGIYFDATKGIGVTSADENLDMIFSMPDGYSTAVSSIQGTVWYNAGKITLDKDTKLTGGGAIAGMPIEVTLEPLDGDGFMTFYTTGVTYGAGTGKLKVTLTKDDLASTFIVNSGEVFGTQSAFHIAVGSDVATDLQDFIPAFNFVTTDPGTYTVNGQTIKTSAANLALTATDNQMVFHTSSDAVEYDGMTFAGNGNVTLTAEAVTLGNGVVATGFGEQNTFVLSEQGAVTADEKVFALTENVSPGISVKGAQDGFIFSRTLTTESEERLGYSNSPDVGKIFSEEFHSAGDDAYRIETDLIGLEKVSGISDGATITGGATLDGEQTLSYYLLETDTNGKFTIGEKTYTLHDGNQIGTQLRARFDVGQPAYADQINNLVGTVSGDFTTGFTKINGGGGVQIIGDSEVSISSGGSGFEIFGLDDGASLKVSESGIYTVNGTALNVTAENVIVGNDEGSASVFFENTSANSLVTGTTTNDSIISTGDNVTINGLSGNDTIRNIDANNVYLDAGDGDNNITQYLNYVITRTGLANYYENNTIVSGSGNDYVYNSGGYYMSVMSGAGNDTVLNVHGYYPTISTGAGDDSISISRGHHQYIDGGDGNDTVIGTIIGDEWDAWAMGEGVTILGGNGDDYISATDSEDASVFGGAGNDTIVNADNESYLDGGDGNDDIQNSAYYVTIEGGAGNDTIRNTDAKEVYINAGDGDNTIIQNLGYAVVTVDGAERLQNYYEHSTIVAGSGNDYISNEGGYYMSVTSGEGNDTIFSNHGYYPTISTGAGDDSIVISRGHYQYIDAGEGNDTIEGTIIGDGWAMGGFATLDGGDGDDYINPIYANNASILGGDGNDTILSNGSDVTIDAGAGDDFISLTGGSTRIEYNSGDGNDTIYGFNENSTLNVNNDAYYSIENGNDLIINTGDSKITLIDAANLSNLNIAPQQNQLLTLVETILKRTRAGYPAMAAIAFHPDEVETEPTNYAAKEDWNITSSDNLNLHAVHYTPENSNDKWALLIHGYGNDHTAMYPFAATYLENGYNVLLIDQRAAGESDGVWLTMGTAESADVALWTQEIARRNANAKITLHGVSMGAATAMLAAARDDITNVTSLVEDCGYTNVMETFSLVNDVYLGLPSEVIAAMDPVAASLTGYYLHDAAPINSIYSAQMPSLFISGSADTVVPTSMLEELYNASGAEVKEKYIIEGAEHARSASVDPVGYSNAVFKFVAEADGEGWNTTNVTDGLYLTGTKYNDTIASSGANVTIDAGDGDNLVKLSGSSEVIVLDGNTTVEGFNTGFGEGADTLYISEEPPAVEFRDSGLTFYSATDTVTFSDIHNTAAVNLYYRENPNPQVTLAQGVFIAENEWYNVADGAAMYYVGTSANPNHGVDFSEITSDVNVTLETDYLTEEPTFWVNAVGSIKGGAGNTTITGSARNDTIFAGTGNNLIRGAAGNDFLVGNTSSNKTGATTFAFGAGSGNDTIQNFDFNTDVIYTDNHIDDFEISGENIIVILESGDQILVENGLNKKFNINEHGVEYKASISNGDLRYNGDIDYYYTSKNSASITASGSEKITMWLNEDANLAAQVGESKTYIGDIKYISANNSTGEVVLSGNSKIDNVITASSGGSTLWGGGASNDTLIGGDGIDKFYYMLGNGNDSVKSAKPEDFVILDGMTMNDIISADVSSTSVALHFSDGGSLTFSTNSGVTFKVGGENGVTYVTDKFGNWT